jgi:hypothetical protein
MGHFLNTDIINIIERFNTYSAGPFKYYNRGFDSRSRHKFMSTIVIIHSYGNIPTSWHNPQHMKKKIIYLLNFQDSRTRHGNRVTNITGLNCIRNWNLCEVCVTSTVAFEVIAIMVVIQGKEHPLLRFNTLLSIGKLDVIVNFPSCFTSRLMSQEVNVTFKH